VTLEERAIHLIGRVETGQGDASRWLAKFNHAYATKIGTPIFPGSLNLRLSEPLDWKTTTVRGLTIEFSREEYGGERDILLVPCRLTSLDGLRAHLWTTSRVLSDPDPPYLIEVVTSVGLRDAFGLEDGDLVELELGTSAGRSR
jgi:CTP-dependent riboflavin kinase